MEKNEEYKEISAVELLRWLKESELKGTLPDVFGKNCTHMDDVFGMYTCEEIVRKAEERIRADKGKEEPMAGVYVNRTVNQVYDDPVLNQRYGGHLWQIRHTLPNASEIAPQVVQTFLDQASQAEDGWTLSIYNFFKESTAEIDCKPSEFSEVVEKVCGMENVTTMSFVGDNPQTMCVVVGLGCRGGHLDFPGWYAYREGRIIKLS